MCACLNICKFASIKSNVDFFIKSAFLHFLNPLLKTIYINLVIFFKFITF